MSATASMNTWLSQSGSVAWSLNTNDELIRAMCIGHRAMHLLFNHPPSYTGPEGTDIPLGAPGERYEASGEFDGWGT
jgi:hypothetical protein